MPAGDACRFTPTLARDMLKSSYDAVVVGAGPNGLAAAIRVAQTGRSVLVVEAAPQIGGGAQSMELTLPGFVHDVCSAVHPLAKASPFFRTLPLAEHGLEWIDPPAPLAHPLDDGTAALLERLIERTVETLDSDGPAYRQLMHPLVRDWRRLDAELLAPPHFPAHPFALARFGRRAVRSAGMLISRYFKDERARALFAGMAAHSALPLEKTATSAFGLVLGAAGHAIGWPVPRGGAQRIAEALGAHLRSLGGEIITDWRVTSVDELPRSRVVLCDLTPRGLLRLAGHGLPINYRRRLERYRYGPGAFKMDWALAAPVPWKAAAAERAGTVHLGGTYEEIAASERAAWNGEHHERPFVLVAQPSLFDETRAPAGRHTLWAYCHVPHASTFDMTGRIESQIERFAPGFRDLILARHAMPPAALERHNANLIGGDINGGAQNISQLFTRPVASLNPYRTPLKGLYICSSSTPPGGGVHGMCGYHAACAALQELA